MSKGRSAYLDGPVITIIEADRVNTVPGSVVDGTFVIHADALDEVFGWGLKPEGLCRRDVCIPASQLPDVSADGQIDLLGVASVLKRPVAVSAEQEAAYIAAPVSQYRSGPAQGRAPIFTLPDLSGERLSLSDLTGRKVLVAAWASW